MNPFLRQVHQGIDVRVALLAQKGFSDLMMKESHMTNVYPRKKIMYAKRFFTHTHTPCRVRLKRTWKLGILPEFLDVLLPCPILDNFCAEVLSEAPVDPPGSNSWCNSWNRSWYQRRIQTETELGLNKIKQLNKQTPEPKPKP